MSPVQMVVLGGALCLATEMEESESVIHSLPPYPVPYSPLVYPPYTYPGYHHQLHDLREIHDAVRTQDADILVSEIISTLPSSEG